MGTQYRKLCFLKIVGLESFAIRVRGEEYRLVLRRRNDGSGREEGQGRVEGRVEEWSDWCIGTLHLGSKGMLRAAALLARLSSSDPLSTSSLRLSAKECRG